MKQCSWCGGAIKDTDAACERCGNGVETAPPGADWSDEELAQIVNAPAQTASSPVMPPRAGAAPPAAPPPARGLNRVELVVVALSIIAGGVITFGVLMLRGASPEAAGAHAEAAAIADAAAVAAPLPPELPLAPKWSHANRARWVPHPKRDIAFELPAENRVHGWTKVVEPILVVRCVGRRTEAFVYTDTRTRMEPQDARRTVGLAFDDEPQSVERWSDSADHDALFAPDAEAFTRRLMAAERLRFGFTPHNAAPVTVQFNVAGLAELLKPSAKQCGWK